jgi:hypothetical protein
MSMFPPFFSLLSPIKSGMSSSAHASVKSRDKRKENLLTKSRSFIIGNLNQSIQLVVGQSGRYDQPRSCLACVVTTIKYITSSRLTFLFDLEKARLEDALPDHDVLDHRDKRHIWSQDWTSAFCILSI